MWGYIVKYIWRLKNKKGREKSVSYGDINMILATESVNEILYGVTIQTSSAVLSHGTIYIFSLMKFGICLEFWF